MDESIITEQSILKYSTVDNRSISDCIVKYIDFFQSDTDFYLVSEDINLGINLVDFTETAHKYIRNLKSVL